mgnify:CR=1 FL=1
MLNIHKTTKFIFLFMISSLMIRCANSEEKNKLKNLQKGKELFTSVGCATCHSISGNKLYGPALNNLLGMETNVIRNENEYTFKIDRNYIRKSIIDPDYEKPLLYKSNKMPKPNLTDVQVDCITDYLISINNNSK